MSYYSIQLTANKAVVVPVAGSVILVDDLGAATGVDIMPNYGGRDLPNMPNRKKAFKFAEAYDSVTLKTTVDATIGIFLSKNDVSLGFADGSLVNVSGQVTVSNTAAARVPVDIGGGTVDVTASNVTIGNDAAHAVPVEPGTGAVFKTLPYQAATINDPAPVAVGAAAGVLLAADPARRGIRIKNVGANPVAIGGAALAFANSAMLIQPGETWNENEAAGAAWYCTCGAGLASTLNVQTIA